MSRRPNGPREPVCHWCGRGLPRHHYLTPMTDVPGAFWKVCGPLCHRRPANADCQPHQPDRW